MSVYKSRSRYQIRKTRKALLKIIDEESYSAIRSYVATEALEYSDDPATMFIDLARSGCQSGMITGLIYYSDTHAFFDRHYDEIEELRGEFEENIGEPLQIKYDLKNWLAWFAFEEIAYRMAREDLGLDL